MKGSNGSPYSGLTAVAWGEGRIDLFWLDAERALWHRSWSAGEWSAAESLGGRLGSAPVVTAWAENELEVFAIFDDGQLWDRTGTGWLGTTGSRSAAS